MVDNGVASVNSRMHALQQQDVSESLPVQPVARLLGHDGPIQDVCFTGTNGPSAQ